MIATLFPQNQPPLSGYNVTIKRILNPLITGPSSTQDCCHNQITYSVGSSALDANYFNWTITNGVIVGAAHGSIVNVSPALTGSVSAVCTASRTSGLPAYHKSSTTFTTTRTPPAPVITASTQDPCAGTTVTYTIANADCITGVDWSLNYGEIVSGLGTSTISVNFSDQILDHSQLFVSALVHFGCYDINLSTNYILYNANVIPTPSGTFGFPKDAKWTFCNQLLDVKFYPSPAFTGSISISPNIIRPWNYWYYDHISSTWMPYTPPGNETFTVTYFNPCIAKSVDFVMQVPYPLLLCEPNPQFRISYPNGKEQSHSFIACILPNPSNGRFSAVLVDWLSGNYSVLAIDGRLIKSGSFANNNFVEVNLPEDVANGVYIFRIETARGIETRKIEKY